MRRIRERICAEPGRNEAAMRIRLDYDRGVRLAEVPDRRLAGVVELPAAHAASAADDVVREALSAPVGSQPLEELARGRRSACVVVPDVTRPMPGRMALPPILSAIEAGGVPRDRVLILIATGLHRPSAPPEIEGMVGAETAQAYRIENHIAHDEAGHVDLGITTTSVPILVDRRYLEADLKVVLGLVEPHFMAGYSGGRKLVCPGLCAEGTIRAFHAPDLIEHPKSANCILEGNPTHLTSTEVARRAGVDFTLNVVLDSRRRVVEAVAGELEQAFLAATERAGPLVTAPVPSRAEIVVVTGGGYPLDATWYQAIKGLVAGRLALRDGGTLILAAGLREGIGSEAFQTLIRETRDLEGFLRRIREPGFYREEQWELEEQALAARRAHVMLYSDGLPRDVQRTLFVEPVGSVEEGIERALERYGADARILAMPRGPYVLPVPPEE